MTKTALFVVAAWTGVGIASAQIPVPKYSDSIPMTAQSQPYRGASEAPLSGPGLPPPDLKLNNYIEQEYFISGTVDGQPYQTTILMRKPSDPKKFSGLVIVEPLHAAGAVPVWGTYKNTIMSGGHGWVTVASQKISAEGLLKKSNPSRYESVSIPTAAGAAEGPQAALMGGGQDKISQAILTQFGALLKSNPKAGPFAGESVNYTILSGTSQTGMLTLRYIVEANPAARLPNGKPIWDAYYPTQAPYTGPITGGDSIVMHAYGEGDVLMFRGMLGGGQRMVRPDSDAPNDRFRTYEMIAVSHAPTRGMKDASKLFPGVPAGSDLTGPGKSLSQFPTIAMYNANFYNLIQWMTKGIAPPHAQPIEFENGQMVRDQYGNAKGGVRSPYVDMPTYRYIASAAADIAASGTGARPNLMYAMLGLQVALPAETVKNLYKTPENYLKMFDAQIDKMVTNRFLLPADATTLKADEAKNPPL